MTTLRKMTRGPRPSHLHTDAEGNTWECNSPYCEDVKDSKDPHPDDGGPQPRW